MISVTWGTLNKVSNWNKLIETYVDLFVSSFKALLNGVAVIKYISPIRVSEKVVNTSPIYILGFKRTRHVGWRTMKAVYSMKLREKWSLVLTGWRIAKSCTAKLSLVWTRSRMFPVLGFKLLDLVTSFTSWQHACSLQNWRNISEQVGWVWLLSRVWLIQ